jgi:hypothetical protein
MRACCTGWSISVPNNILYFCDFYGRLTPGVRIDSNDKQPSGLHFGILHVQPVQTTSNYNAKPFFLPSFPLFIFIKSRKSYVE